MRNAKLQHPPEVLWTLTAAIHQCKLLPSAVKLLSQGEKVLPELLPALFNNHLSFYNPDILR